jgi:DNA repair ATPase RecN
MYFQLVKIVLWSRDPQIEPRVLNFEPGMVNVVMGLSRTGKSALIQIMDYCFGAKTCAIPKKVIRASCSWFGVVIATAEGQKLFARREPDEQDATDEMFVLEASEVIIP